MKTTRHICGHAHSGVSKSCVVMQYQCRSASCTEWSECGSNSSRNNLKPSSSPPTLATIKNKNYRCHWKERCILCYDKRVKKLCFKFRFVFWDVLPCKMIVDRRFRGTCYLHHQGSTSQKTNLNFILAAVRTWNLTYVLSCFITNNLSNYRIETNPFLGQWTTKIN
jgi:hypothetical protein